MIASALVRYLVGFGIVVASLGIGWFSLKMHYENIGYAKAIHAIALQNEKAVKDSKDAKKEVDACIDSGGDWDISSGSCVRK